MSHSRRSKRREAIHIDHSSIKYDSTCVNIVPGGLPITMACDICQPKLDIHSEKSSKKDKKRDISTRQTSANNTGLANGLMIIQRKLGY